MKAQLIGIYTHSINMHVYGIHAHTNKVHIFFNFTYTRKGPHFKTTLTKRFTFRNYLHKKGRMRKTFQGPSHLNCNIYIYMHTSTKLSFLYLHLWLKNSKSSKIDRPGDLVKMYLNISINHSYNINMKRF